MHAHVHQNGNQHSVSNNVSRPTLSWEAIGGLHMEHELENAKPTTIILCFSTAVLPSDLRWWGVAHTTVPAPVVLVVAKPGTKEMEMEKRK